MQRLLLALPDLQPEAERGREVNTTEPLHVFGRPDMTDRFGRVWRWHHNDTYLHDGISCPEKFIRDKNMQLPNRKLRGNPNYAGLCEICTIDW